MAGVDAQAEAERPSPPRLQRFVRFLSAPSGPFLVALTAPSSTGDRVPHLTSVRSRNRHVDISQWSGRNHRVTERHLRCRSSCCHEPPRDTPTNAPQDHSPLRCQRCAWRLARTSYGDRHSAPTRFCWRRRPWKTPPSTGDIRGQHGVPIERISSQSSLYYVLSLIPRYPGEGSASSGRHRWERGRRRRGR
jgi:hypothetical protein